MSKSSALTVQQSAISMSALALPCVAGFVFSARESFTYLFFAANPQDGASAMFLLNMLLLAAAAFQALGRRSSQAPRVSGVRPVQWVAVFLALALISISWSETVSKPLAIGYWLNTASDTFIVLLLCRLESAQSLQRRMLSGYVWGAVFVAIVMWFAPTMQDLRPGDDDLFSPNAIGFLIGLGVFLAQFLMREDKAWKWPAIFLAISLLRSLSKTTLVAFSLAQLFLLLKDRGMSRQARRSLVIGGLAVFALFSPLILAYYRVYLNAGNQAETLTGRVGIWTFVLLRAMESPWIGHGFHSFRHVIPAFGTFDTWHAHNEILQEFYLYGALGISALIGVYGSFLVQARKLQDPSRRSLSIALILFVVVRGLADAERFDLSFPLWMIVLLGLGASSESAAPEGTA